MHGSRGMTAMHAPDHIEAPSWSIRPELPVDLDQIHELHREAFRGPVEAELVDAIRAGAGFLPELSLVAVAPDDSVFGHILISRVPFEPEGPTPRAAMRWRLRRSACSRRTRAAGSDRR